MKKRILIGALSITVLLSGLVTAGTTKKPVPKKQSTLIDFVYSIPSAGWRMCKYTGQTVWNHTTKENLIAFSAGLIAWKQYVKPGIRIADAQLQKGESVGYGIGKSIRFCRSTLPHYASHMTLQRYAPPKPSSTLTEENMQRFVKKQIADLATRTEVVELTKRVGNEIGQFETRFNQLDQNVEEGFNKINNRLDRLTPALPAPETSK